MLLKLFVLIILSHLKALTVSDMKPDLNLVGSGSSSPDPEVLFRIRNFPKQIPFPTKNTSVKWRILT